MAEYRIGDYDRRPWGCWLVTNVPASGEIRYCEKIIVVAPGKILSLQSHALRHETWVVLEGTLATIVNGECAILGSGQKRDVPVGALHCMANLSDMPCIVKERQTGICRESDITRYLDSYGRITTGTKNEKIIKSVNLYLDIVEQIKGVEKRYA
ncbi:MAG: cupin domain-containing protein [Micavibrio sp.]